MDYIQLFMLILGITSVIVYLTSPEEELETLYIGIGGQIWIVGSILYGAVSRLPQ